MVRIRRITQSLIPKNEREREREGDKERELNKPMRYYL
jgi:hypothetical protein